MGDCSGSLSWVDSLRTSLSYLLYLLFLTPNRDIRAEVINLYLQRESQHCQRALCALILLLAMMMRGKSLSHLKNFSHYITRGS